MSARKAEFAQPRQRQHDYDPVTLRCRHCTVRATEGISVCVNPDEAEGLSTSPESSTP